MFKKLLLTGLAVAAGLFILNHTRLGSYGHTAFGKIKKAAQREVPVEFEIERIRQEIARLTPDMKKHLTGMADEIVAIENLKDEITVSRGNLNKKKEQLRAAAADLKAGVERVSYVYDGRTYRPNQLRERVQRDLASCQRLEKDLVTREQILENKEKGLESAKEQLQAMRDQKAELELAVEQIESEVKAIRVAQAKSKFAIDDSRLSHIKQSLQDLRNRMKRETIKADLYGQFIQDGGTPETKKVSTKDLVKDLDSYLNGEKAEAHEVASGATK